MWAGDADVQEDADGQQRQNEEAQNDGLQSDGLQNDVNIPDDKFQILQLYKI